jgi:hypothetical protein
MLDVPTKLIAIVYTTITRNNLVVPCKDVEVGFLVWHNNGILHVSDSGFEPLAFVLGALFLMGPMIL